MNPKVGGFMESQFKDKILICVDCNEEFVFTINAQEYFAQKGFHEDPKRCKSCYMELKRKRRPSEYEAPMREHRGPDFEDQMFKFPEDGSGNGNSRSPEQL
jgi:hypothetical protein